MELIISEERFQKQAEVLFRHFPDGSDKSLTIVSVQGEMPGLSIEKNGDSVKIVYQQEVHFYRAFGILMAHLEEEHFSCEEKAFTERLGNMFDCSRNAVLKVETVKRYIEYMALLGMNDLMLYTEDTYEVEGHPYFGAFRGRYSRRELKELDAYAKWFGIELVPCVQTLAHLHTYLRWPQTEGLRDNQDILLAEEERVYALIEDMIRSLREAFSGKRIHVGMDEAYALGLGKYLLKHGYQNRTSIMKRHLDKVAQICKKYGFEPMMWSDMYFMLASEDASYYHVDEDYEWRAEDKPDPDMTLVYWDYYSPSKEMYQKMVNLHRKLSDKMYFAGGAWTWNGVAPNYARALETTKKGLEVMKEKQVKNWFCTFWEDDGAETPMETGILPMAYFAEMAYREQVLPEELIRRVEEVFGVDAERMLLLDLFDNCCENDPHNLHSACPSKWGLYQDPLLGIMDGQIEGKGLGARYKELAEKPETGTGREGSFGELFTYYQLLAQFLALKTELGIRLRKAYLAKQKEELSVLAEETIPECIRIMERLHLSRERLWMSQCKPQGYEVIDIRLSGVKGRLQSAKRRVLQYLSGEVECLEELEEERLPFRQNERGLFSHNRWEQTASACNLCEI